MTNSIKKAGVLKLGDRVVTRLGYGAMQLAGPGVFGPPRDRAAAVAVLREAVALGVNHIDTSDYYGPYVVNEIIKEALHPYPDDLVIVTKVGALRGEDGSWNQACSREHLIDAVHDNLKRLGLERLEVVNFRSTFGEQGRPDGSMAPPVAALMELRAKGLIGHVGVSNVTAVQLAEARAVGPIVCVQNHYNLVHRGDDAMIDDLARDGIAYTPFFPLGGFTPLQSSGLSTVASRLGATPMQTALAWLLQRSPNVLLIPGTSSVAHLRENLAVADLDLPQDALAELDAISSAGTPGGHD